MVSARLSPRPSLRVGLFDAARDGRSCIESDGVVGKEVVAVYYNSPFCCCRACGLDWKAVQLEDCPRCARDQYNNRIKELEQGIEDLYDELREVRGSLKANRLVDLIHERDEARTIARQLVALVRKLRGDLDGTKGQL